MGAQTRRAAVMMRPSCVSRDARALAMSGTGNGLSCLPSGEGARLIAAEAARMLSGRCASPATQLFELRFPESAE